MGVGVLFLYLIKDRNDMKLIKCIIAAVVAIYGFAASANDTTNTMKKVLFVVTSHSELGNTGKKTGFYFSEVAHPYYVLSRDYEIDIVSPQGGAAPYEGLDQSDSISMSMYNQPAFRSKIANTLTPAQVNPEDYCAIYYAGGHGVMWDFADNTALAAICAKIYENGGVVGAVCHGPAGLLNVALANGQKLVAGKHLVSFTNREEDLNGTSPIVPYMLENALLDAGCTFEQQKPWSDFTVEDQRLITGQNPMSALTLGYRIAAALSAIK